MTQMPIQTTRKGMILSQPIYVNGRLLLSEGVVLTEKYIDRLKSYGIKEVAIKVEKEKKEFG